jgi:F420-dependent oxidoreductase-like protein
MRLGLNLGYWGAGNDADNLALAREAERLGYAVVWAAEAYGSDAATVLAWVAAQTERIDVGSAVFQIPARSPAMTAMTAATLDTLSGGRFRLGLGVSGPQVSEGWHGARFDKPLARTREYVDIVRLALARERVEYHGTHYELPLPDGPGKALKLTVHPARERIPVYLAAVGPRNVELAGEIADGWLAIFFSPEHAKEQLGHLDAGLATSGRDRAAYDIVATAPLVVGDDVEACAAPVRAYAALYVGGMGSRDKNFYNALAVRMGYGAAAAEVQERYLA